MKNKKYLKSDFLFLEKLKFRPTPVNSKLELGIEQRIYCKADGKDEPTVHWLKADAADFPSHVEDQSGILLFKTVEYTDAGKYTCIATSKQGSINATIQLDVVSESSLPPASSTESLRVFFFFLFIQLNRGLL